MKLFAKKIGMTHIYDKNGAHIPVTVVEAQKTVLCGERTQEKDGYNALVFARVLLKGGRKSINNQFKAVEGVIGKVSEQKMAHVDKTQHQDGLSIDPGAFDVGGKVEICTKSKGKGFQGTVKRHDFTTGPKTHGSHNYRQPGSIGSTNPDRTVKGKKMPGHMGHETVTLKEIEILKYDAERNHLYLKGSIPGAPSSIIEITKYD